MIQDNIKLKKPKRENTNQPSIKYIGELEVDTGISERIKNIYIYIYIYIVRDRYAIFILL